MGIIVRDLLDNNVDDVQVAVNESKEVRASTSSRYVSYCALYPSLSVHEIYIRKTDVTFKKNRANMTDKIKMNCPFLAIEQGRWNRRGRGRLSLNERLCSYDQI